MPIAALASLLDTMNCPLCTRSLGVLVPVLRPTVNPAVDAGTAGGHVHVVQSAGVLVCAGGHSWSMPEVDIVLTRVA